MYQLKLVQEAFVTTQFGIRIKLCVDLSTYKINIKNDWNLYKGGKKNQVLLPLRLFQFKRRKVGSADMQWRLKHEMWH